jgi:hypothetical protein
MTAAANPIGEIAQPGNEKIPAGAGILVQGSESTF